MNKTAEASEPQRSLSSSLLLRLQVEEFLIHEATLLDEWRLDEWVELFTEDARYIVPTTDARDGDASTTLVLLEDNLTRIRGRVTRLKSRRAHREFPSSRTRRLITNTSIVGDDGEVVIVHANFAIWRFRRHEAHTYVGRFVYHLVRAGDSFAIRLRRAELDLESLRPHGTVSIIL